MHYIIFLFLTAAFMGLFERNLVLFIIVMLAGLGAIKLIGSLMPKQGG